MANNKNIVQEENQTHKRLPRYAKILIAVAAVVLAAAIAVLIYAVDYYEAADDAEAVMAGAVTDGDYTVFDGGGDVGFIFYPGGKVEHSAYAPLMQALADKGISCVLVEMPLKLAVLNSDAWEAAIETCPNVTKWYIGGHSLGGAMAASALDSEVFSGLVLLGAYSTEEITVPSLTVYGSHDLIMNREKYDTGLPLLNDNTEVVIDGGNHSGFADYGEQKGDGFAELSNQEQIAITADLISDFINAGN